jgi:phosphohistidine phosphatase
MEIYLVRHGVAEEPLDALKAGRPDPERRLTEEGREKTSRVARALAKKIRAPGLIAHSPYARAAETARILAHEFPSARLEKHRGLIPHDSPGDALALLCELLPSADSVMLVGHEPHLSLLSGLLLTGKEIFLLEFKKAGVACIEWNGPARPGRLRFLVPPRFF